MEVLAGAYNTLKRCSPVLCLELFKDTQESKEQVNFLNKLGYNIIDVIVKDYIFKKKS